MAIDWGFISGLEGGQHLTGYVPDAEGSNSGVTIATGVDLGQISASEMSQIPAALQAKLEPYLGLRNEAAINLLTAQPLAVTSDEADAIDQAAQASRVALLTHQYDQHADGPFEGTPDAAQTVMASVTFQYGTPWVRCPRFWQACIAEDWAGVISELNNFGDSYPTRRKKEAAYLQAALANKGAGA